ncbi:MAG: hypothetical protein Q4G68_08860 [Planctomycetia bacterium]|nr:hypothetical protein [Planctomycetia bacterium]
MLKSMQMFVVLLLTAASVTLAADAVPEDTVNIGSRRELFLDDYLIANRDKVDILVHRPDRKEISLVFNKPWEGDSQSYFTTFQDDQKYRMYYHAWGQFPSSKLLSICYAESDDGINWTCPELGICEFEGSTANNIVINHFGEDFLNHDFNPFWDKKPGTPPEQKYKAVGFGYSPSDPDKGGLFAWSSPDAIHWTLMQEAPILRGYAFDSQNVAFWSEKDNCYVLYFRHFANGVDVVVGTRIVMKATSDDLLHWTVQGTLQFPEGEGPVHGAQYYTNQIKEYYRAPETLIGFPARYVDHGGTESTKLLPEWDLREKRIKIEQRLGTTVTDSVFIWSRDGMNFRQSNDVFVAPGLRTKHNWCYGDNYLSWHVVETASADDDSPRELSIYAVESYQTDNESRLRRYTLRLDGFSSLHAKNQQGTVTTKPIIFEGAQLSLNAATSAAGEIRVEVLRPDGSVIPGFSSEECDLIYGDSLDRRVTWKGNADMTPLAGQPIVLRFTMKEADLYSIKWEQQ